MNDKRLENILSKCRSFYRLLSLMSRAFASKMLIVLPLIEIWSLSHKRFEFSLQGLAGHIELVSEDPFGDRESTGNCSRR